MCLAGVIGCDEMELDGPKTTRCMFSTSLAVSVALPVLNVEKARKQSP